VVFFDTGTAVSPGNPMRLSDFKTDGGLGLRFSISRAASNSVVRIDFAYPLDRDFFGRRRLLVSFSSGQVF
jgi:outer membrane translocation and assembly module TamA